jgi:hypothetical protein
LLVLHTDILYPKVVDNEGEADGTCVLFPQTGGCLALAVSVFLEAFFEQLLGNDTCLWKAVHPLLNLAVVVDVRGGFAAKVVVLDDVVWHVGNAKAHVFISGHRGIEIKILDVHRHEFCSIGRDDAVD